MNTPRFRVTVLAMFFAFAMPCFGADAPITAEDIEVTLVPDKSPIEPCEPIYASLVVKNISKRELVLWVSADFRRSGDHWPLRIKSGKIKLAAATKEGATLPEYDWVRSREIDYSSAEMYRPETIPVSRSYTFRVFVPQWIVFTEVGAYTLTATAKLVFSIPPAGGYSNGDPYEQVPTMIFVRPLSTIMNRPAVVDADKTAVAIPFTATASIVVEPPPDCPTGDAPPPRIDAVTDELIKSAAAGDPEAVDKLLEIPSRRVIPWLLQQLKKNSPVSKYDEMKSEMRIDLLHALSKFNDDAALAGIKAAMESRAKGDGGSTERDIILRYLLQSPHPGAIPYFLTFYNSPDYAVRQSVVEALGTKIPAAQAVPVLEKMAKDKNEMIRQAANYYLKKLQPE